MKRWLTLIGVVVVLVLVIGGLKAYGIFQLIQGFKAQGEPKFTVSTQVAASAEWLQELSAVGSLRAVRGVDVVSEVPGLVQNIAFKSGQEVKAGTPLVQLVADTDIAHLHSLQASAELAETNYKRDLLQFEAEAISKSQLDTSALTLKGAKALAAEQAALVAKKTIQAPFSGRLGISTLNPGAYLNAADKIVTLQQLDPIYVDFSLPQQALTQLRVGQKISAVSDSFPEQTFAGEISVINPIIDTDTRNVLVQATLRNPDRKLLPGMFASVKIVVGAPQRYLTLPQTAVTFNPYGETVFVIVHRGEENAADPNKPQALQQTEGLGKADADLKAEEAAKAKAAKGEKDEKPKDAAPASTEPPPLVARQLFITTGPTRGDQIAITSGLKEGDEVVTSGQLKLKNGVRIVVNNSVVPANSPDPKPVDQ
ncbi:MAG: efflux RND transporter periplasmic adaptor subunit [Nevskia sp.]|nr:efflux RND transporter periplasmic adaptor subunit [Nevskia sp.]